MKEYGLIGSFKVRENHGEALAQILPEASELVSLARGCLHYVVAMDPDDPDRNWVSEIWDSKEDHDRSLQAPGVKELISRLNQSWRPPRKRGRN